MCGQGSGMGAQGGTSGGARGSADLRTGRDVVTHTCVDLWGQVVSLMRGVARG